MNKLQKIILGASALGILVGGAYLGNSGPVTNMRGTYRGYYENRADGYNVLIFDRENNKQLLRAIGDPKKFKIGNEYDIKVKDPLFGLDEIVSSKDSD